jgi:hypothetical protein
MKNIPEALKEEFAKWTHGLDVVTPMFPDPQTVIVIGKKLVGTGKAERTVYEVLTFFIMGEKWVVSCDARAVTAEDAFCHVARRVSPLGAIPLPGREEISEVAA